MLARIQQIIVSTLLAAAIAAVAVGAYAGWPSLGAIVVALILLGYLGVLAIEFVWLHGSYQADDPMRPRAAQLIRAWAAEIVVAPRVFLWRQPFRSQSETDHLPSAPIARHGVVLIHGFFCNRGLWNPWMERLRQRGVPFIAVNLEPVFGSIDDYRSAVGAAVDRLQEATGLAPVIVAHSMGGLAARAWAAANPLAPIHRMVTIASPHAGTRLGGPGLGANTAQMRLRSEWLADLEARESPESRSRLVCFWSHCDNIVFPTRNATLPGADNRHLQGTPHVQMAYHPAVIEEVLRIVAVDT